MAARKLWKGEEAIPKNREPLKKKEWPPRPTLKKKEWPPRPTLKKKEWPQKEEPLTIMKIKAPPIGLGMEHPGLLKTPKPIKLKPAPRRSPTLKWNIKKR